MARTALAAGRDPARPCFAPVRADRMAGFRVGSSLRIVPGGIFSLLLGRRAGADAHPRDGIALRRRDGYRELLYDIEPHQPRSGADDHRTPNRRRRNPALQALLSVLLQVPTG